MILNAVAPGVMKTPVLAQAASARDPIRAKLLAGFASRHPSYAQSVGGACAHRGKRTLSPSRIHELTAIHVSYVARTAHCSDFGNRSCRPTAVLMRTNGTTCGPSDVGRLGDGNHGVP